MKKHLLLIILFPVVFVQKLIAQYLDNKKPNIVVFIADDAGLDFGCYGNKFIKTPNIDNLASQGVRFNNFFVSSPQCSPSRIAMMSGMFGHTLGVEDLHTPIDDTTKLIPAYLKEAGYYTGSMCKTHWGPNGTNQFDFYYNGQPELYAESYMTEKNGFFRKYQDFLNESADKPFFLWVGFIDPHRPYKEKHTDKVSPPDKVKLFPALIDGPKTREDVADYYDEIHRLDQHVGFMMAELRKRKKLDNTVVIFLSDNGMPFIRAKAYLYETGINVPMIISWPGKTKNGSVHNNGLLSGVDIAPTILDLAGVVTPPSMYGKSFKPLILNPALKGREVIFSERNWHDTEEYSRCIRTEKYKLIYNAYPNTLSAITGDMRNSPAWFELLDAKNSNKLNSQQRQVFNFPRPGIELYDLEKDPYESKNLAEKQEYYQIAVSLYKQLRDWQKETRDTQPEDREKKDLIDRVTGFGFGLIPQNPK